MLRIVLNDRDKCLSRLYRSQKTRRRSSLFSTDCRVSGSCSRRHAHRGLAHGESGPGHLSSSLFILSEKASLVAFDHHLWLSDLKSPPETAIDNSM